MKAVGVVRHLFYTSKIIDSSGTKSFNISTLIMLMMLWLDTYSILQK